MLDIKNYSRQRSAIIEALKGTTCHPTATWVHETVRKTIPNISLGTVYRNLSELSSAGQILTIHVGNSEHYDGDISDHQHFCCKKCGGVFDIPFGVAPKTDVEEQLSCKVHECSVVFYGVCKQCLED